MVNLQTFGNPTYSNINLNLGVNSDLFVGNLDPQPNKAWKSRLGMEFIRNLKGEIKTIFFDTTRQEILLYINGSLYRQSDNYTSPIFTGPIENQIVNFGNRVYFISNQTVYVWDGVSAVVATYLPTRLLIAPNGISTVLGSNEATIRIENHGLIVGQDITLSGFTERMGNQDLNQTVPVTTVVDANFVKVDYPMNFNEDIDESGGNGIITANFPANNFPQATTIAEFQNRLYLGNGQTLYISSLVTPSDQLPRFSEKDGLETFLTTTDGNQMLNQAISTIITEPFWVNVGDQKQGNIISLHSSAKTLYVFKQIGVFEFGGSIAYPISPILLTDTVVNDRAVSSNGAVTYFMGYNSFYKISSKIETIGDIHEYYIKNKENDRVRMACWDNKVFCVLGDFEILNLDGDMPDLQVKDVCLVFHEPQQLFTFYTEFAPDDFEVVFENFKPVMYLNRKEDLVKHAGLVDIYDDIVTTIVTHLRYLTSDYTKSKSFNKVYLAGRRIVDTHLHYKTAEATGWTEAIQRKGKDQNLVEFDLEKDKKGRAIQLFFTESNKSERIYEGYILEAKIEA